MAAQIEGSESSERFPRIGGGGLANLRLKPAEQTLDPPGFSVLKGGSPAEAARQMKEAFSTARKLHDAAKVIGSASAESIQDAGFEVLSDPTRRLPNHHRIIHPEGLEGFREEKLTRLSKAFSDSIVDEIP